MISESAELFEPRTEAHQGKAHQGIFGQDLVGVLEDRVRQLVELREAVAARDRRIVELDAKLAASERARAELVQRIDALLADVEALMREADADPEGDAR